MKGEERPAVGSEDTTGLGSLPRGTGAPSYQTYRQGGNPA